MGLGVKQMLSYLDAQYCIYACMYVCMYVCTGIYPILLYTFNQYYYVYDIELYTLAGGVAGDGAGG